MKARLTNHRIICLMGPTASGKSALSMELAELFPFEIISVDSAMIYRSMNIGTAKPSKQELAEVPYHLIDIRDPHESYSAAEFCTDTIKKIDEIIEQKKNPLLVGGTMLYFKALQQGLSDLPSANAEIRKRLLEEAKQRGWESLHERLNEIDPITAKRIHPNDPQRIQRALEVFELTGKPLSELCMESKTPPLQHKTLNIAIMPSDRSQLHKHIARRFRKMLNDGFIEEVEALYHRGDLHKNLPSMRTVGYRQIWDYLDGKLDFAQMQEKTLAATRQLAKRQITWLRSWPNLHCFDSAETKRTKAFIFEFLGL